MSACRRLVPGFTGLVPGLVLSLVAGVLVGLPPAAQAAAPVEPSESSVPVKAAVSSAAQPSATDGVGVTGPGPARLPSEESVRVSTSGATVRVGGLPVTVSGLSGADDDFLSGGRVRLGVTAGGPKVVQVATADPAVVRAAGVRGVIVAVSQMAGAAASAEVELKVGFSEWAGLFGANYGDRLRMVALPECALTTPQVAKCQVQVPLDSVNAAGEVSAKVALQGAAPLVVGILAGPGSAGGTFGATSLSPSYSWSAGGQGGSFSWSYPL
jgi:hypothetical protein